MLEGEEELKTLLVDKNIIVKLDNLISLPKLEILDCSHNKIHDISEVKSLNGLRTLCLGFNAIENIEPLKHLKRVKDLDLQRNRIMNIPKGSLSCLFNLQRMNLSFNYISEFSTELCSLEGLKELNLSNNQIFEISKGKCFKMCGLEILNLASNNFEKVEFLQGLKDLKSLQTLNLLSNPLFVMKQKEEKDAIIKSIIEMVPCLKTLNTQEISPKVNDKQIDCVTSEKIYQPKSTKNEFMNLDSLESSLEAKKVAKPQITQRNKNKTQNENVICIIEDEWNSELQRLKNSGKILL